MTTVPEPTPPVPARPTNVVAALAAVAAELPGIGKREESGQGYSYRGIEAITAAVQHVLGRHGVVFVPRIVNRKTIEVTVAGKPWTEEQLSVVYTVRGPAWRPRGHAGPLDQGCEDSIEVGPLLGLGRDNSDKGANKAMTQCYKYALLQTLCIGDSKDDADREPAHEADAPERAASPSQLLADKVKVLDPALRAKVRQFCDSNSIPRVPKQMTEEEIDRVDEHVDALLIAAEQDAAAEAPQAPPETPVGASGAAATPVDAPPPPDPLRIAATAEVTAMGASVLAQALIDRGAVPPLREDERRGTLIELLVAERARERDEPAPAPED